MDLEEFMEAALDALENGSSPDELRLGLEEAIAAAEIKARAEPVKRERKPKIRNNHSQ